VTELLLDAAHFRQESRGGHYRLDAPAPQAFWQRHTLQRRQCGLSTEGVGQGQPN
jgi:L-aspartate oxidase